MPKVESSVRSKLRPASASTSTAAGGKSIQGPLFNKELGQHILKNPLVVTPLLFQGGVKTYGCRTEVGPGTGNVSVKIVPKCKKLTVVEMDPRMAAELSKRVQGTPEQRKLDIVVGDFLKVQLPYFDVCISNTPYQISSPLPLWRCAILMFQREFALRLVAKPGDELYCRLSRQTVVRIEPRQPPPPINFDEWDGMLRLLFTRKNKTVNAIMKTGSTVELLEHNYKTRQCLKRQGWGEMRAAKMDQDDFLKLLNAFVDAGFRFTAK
ncbi:S-adenosyl-L-methionine-dependent methyltransferase [Chytridium lagenaria]|nr:S-adenosyl-L-methionine-dependent methyltransferase [Chytridium lagenaria]